MSEKRNFGPLLIIIAASLWGSMGIFVRRFTEYGFNSLQIVAIRVAIAALLFFILLLLKDKKGLSIAPADLPLFFGLGLGSVLFFTACYFTAINMMSLSAAAILLYTSPIWIMLMSLVFFREKLTAVKLVALALAFSGCVCVSGLSGGKIPFAGLLIGLGAGIGYGLYSILGTVALRKYSPYTVTFYTFLICSVGALAICRPAEMFRLFASAPSLWALLGFCVLSALVTAFLPYLAYTMGLRTVPASKAGIIATVEPLVATVIGLTVFSEPLTFLSVLGIVLILSAVIILNVKKEAESK